MIVPLRKMLADAVRQGLILANPAARADLPPAQDFVGKEIPSAHTDAIREALLELAPLDPLRREPDLFFVCLFDVALGTGLRLGELRALCWRDVDRDRRLIRVERAYSRQQLRKPKTESGVRSVPLFPSVEAAFRELAAPPAPTSSSSRRSPGTRTRSSRSSATRTCWMLASPRRRSASIRPAFRRRFDHAWPTTRPRSQDGTPCGSSVSDYAENKTHAFVHGSAAKWAGWPDWLVPS